MPILTAATTAALSAVPTGALRDGMLGYVEADASHWFLRKSSTAALSAGVIASGGSSGGTLAGRWLLWISASGSGSEQLVTGASATIQDGRDVLVVVIRADGITTDLTLSDTALFNDKVTVKLDTTSVASIVTVNQSTGFNIDGATTFVFSDLGDAHTFRKTTVGWKVM